MELPHTPNEAWRAVPQHVVEDAFDLLIFIGRERGQLFDSVSMDPVMNFLVLFLTRPKYIRSPHLRAKFGELLFSVFLPNENQSKNPLSKPSVQCGLLLSSHHLACTFSIFSLSLSTHNPCEHNTNTNRQTSCIRTDATLR